MPADPRVRCWRIVSVPQADIIIAEALIAPIYELTRYRTSLVRMRSAEVNRLHKTLEGANIKLGSVASVTSIGIRVTASRQCRVDAREQPPS